MFNQHNQAEWLYLILTCIKCASLWLKRAFEVVITIKKKSVDNVCDMCMYVCVCMYSLGIDMPTQ